MKIIRECNYLEGKQICTYLDIICINLYNDKPCQFLVKMAKEDFEKSTKFDSYKEDHERIDY